MTIIILLLTLLTFSNSALADDPWTVHDHIDPSLTRQDPAWCSKVLYRGYDDSGNPIIQKYIAVLVTDYFDYDYPIEYGTIHECGFREDAPDHLHSHFWVEFIMDVQIGDMSNFHCDYYHCLNMAVMSVSGWSKLACKCAHAYCELPDFSTETDF